MEIVNYMPPIVDLFVTCILDTLYPETAMAVVEVLETSGVGVNFPMGQTCCGQPAFNAGLRPLARKMAQQTIRVLEQTSHPVIIPSGSCAGMIRHGYVELFGDDPGWLPRAQKLAERTFEFTEYLVDQLGVRDLKARYSGKIAYHASCHLLRDLGVNRQPLELLWTACEGQLVELPEQQDCCGFGGLFSIEHPEISAAMLERKIANFVASGADTLVTCDGGCIAHINGGLHRRGLPLRAMHIADILAGTRTIGQDG